MKCHSCDKQVSRKMKKCNHCGAKIKKEDYNLPSTRQIIDDIDSIKAYANFIGMFYVKSIILLLIALVTALVSAYFILILHKNIMYIVLMLIAITSFNYFLEMRKIEKTYQDFKLNSNRYYALWPILLEKKTVFADASLELVNKSVLEQRQKAYNKRESQERLVRFNTYRIYHPYKPKMFMDKETFYKKFFNKDTTHFLQSGNLNDETYVALEGMIHGFLIMSNYVVCIYNIPKKTKKLLESKDVNTYKTIH